MISADFDVGITARMSIVAVTLIGYRLQFF